MDNAADALLRDVDGDIGLGGSLVGVINASEALDFTTAGLGVDAALVGLLAVVEGSGDVDKEEGAGLGDDVTGSLARVLVRSNGSGDDSSTSAGELAGNEGDALDVLVTVLAAEAELRGELVTDSVTEQERDRASTLLVQGNLQGTSNGILAGVHVTGKEDGEALVGTRGVGLAQDLDNLGVREPLGDVSAGAQALAELGAGDVQGLGAGGNLISGLVLVGVRAVGDLLELNDLDAELLLVLLDKVLGIVGAVEVFALGVLAGAGVVTSDDEVSSTVVLTDDGVPERLTGSTHTHSQGQQTEDGHAVGVARKKGLVGTDTGEVVDVTRLGETDNGVNQDIGLTSASGTDGQLTVSTVHGVSAVGQLSRHALVLYNIQRTWSGKRQLGSSRACRSGSAAPRECLVESVSAFQKHSKRASHTAQGDIVVVVKLVDGLDLSTNVEFLGDVVQVLDSRMVHIATENMLSLLRPKLEREPSTSARPTHHANPWHHLPIAHLTLHW